MHFLSHENLNSRLHYNLPFGIMRILKLFRLGIPGCFTCGTEAGGLTFAYNESHVRVWVKESCKIYLFFNFLFCEHDLNNSSNKIYFLFSMLLLTTFFMTVPNAEGTSE